MVIVKVSLARRSARIEKVKSLPRSSRSSRRRFAARLIARPYPGLASDRHIFIGLNDDALIGRIDATT